MTRTSHRHYIAGTPKDDQYDIVPINCGGPGVCETCTFEFRWYKDYAGKKAAIFPSEIDGLDSSILRKIATKIRDRNPLEHKGNKIILRRKTSPIHALANALDGVADDLSRKEN